MKCRVCDSIDLEMVIDLGMQPWCNHFLKKEEVGKEPFYPLHLLYCNNCSTSQLDYTVDKKIMFSNHTYLSGITKSLSNHFKNVASIVNDKIIEKKRKKTILDIGSNDGTLLRHFIDLDWEVLGVESSKDISVIANKNGVPTLNKFYNYETSQEIGKSFDAINASGVFFHLEELHSVCRAIKACLNKEGIFVVQFLYMKSIMENVAFDQIYHEHLLYYTIKTIKYLLSQYDLEIFDAYLADIHGGQMVAFVSHNDHHEKTKRFCDLEAKENLSDCNSIESYKNFKNNIDLLKKDNINYLNNAKNNNKIIYGMGAPVKGNTLLNFFNIGTEFLDCLLEKNNLRENLFSPGKHIPVYMEDKIKKIPDIYYVLAWNFKKEILGNNQALINKGVEFYFPIKEKN